MAIAFDASGVGSGSSGASTISWSHTCTGTNLVLIVGVTNANGQSFPTSVTYNSVAMTRIAGASINDGTSSTVNSMWYLVAPSTGSNTVQVTMAGSTSLVGGSASFTGVNQVTPVEASNTGTGSGTTLSGSITTIAANAMVVDSAGVSANLVFTNSQTTAWPLQQFTGASGMGSYKAFASPGTQTTSWGLGTSHTSTIAIISLQPPSVASRTHLSLLGVS